ncbi:MAG: hypothetical protein HY228_00970 [Candidatus Yonathbacteria bacterium]|nr:hypothetical protein [Candidatus Yonathbacteria bacterium]
MQNYNIKIATTIFAGLIISMPILASAKGLVPCDGPNCDFNQLMIMVNRIIRFLFIDVAIPLTTISFMYIGGRLVLYQDKAGEWKKAKDAFENIGIGFGIMVGAFVLIKFVLSQFLATGFSVNFLLK